MAEWYAKKDPAAVIKGMMGDMATFTGPEAQEKATEAASDPGRVERLISLMK